MRCLRNSRRSKIGVTHVLLLFDHLPTRQKRKCKDLNDPRKEILWLILSYRIFLPPFSVLYEATDSLQVKLLSLIWLEVTQLFPLNLRKKFAHRNMIMTPY